MVVVVERVQERARLWIASKWHLAVGKTVWQREKRGLE